MEQQPQNTRLRNAGFLTFFFSGICAISSGVVVSLLQEKYGFAYGMTGTLLSLMSIGNLLAGFLTGVLPGVLGFKPSVLLLTTGYALGYGMMGLSGAELLLLDEHTAALDPHTADRIMELTDRVVREKQLTAMMVTHNLRYAVEYGSRLLMMDKGHLVLDAAGEEKKHMSVDDILDLFTKISIECGN